jgi:hypothetical protein
VAAVILSIWKFQENDVHLEMNMKAEADADQNKLAFVSEARKLLALFQDPEWRATAEQTDEEHVADFTRTLAGTRQTFPGLQKKTCIHWIGIEGDNALAVTGNAPDSGDRARALVGFLRNMPFLLEAVEKLINQQKDHAVRVSELIEHNTVQLMENRAQRETIRKQQAKIDWLLNNIPGVQAV